ncbi:MAG: peptidoglycan bridge formation glycyltransferase FemA/FemB family protein [Candidatus Uhrbacteria bacterium]|nr:peptidoglycan bridge formation glycyltransferase FemA/FemB family protein [Candidatus Uhrbacteria bacterium]
MDRNSWNQFVLEHGPRSGRFLQSWEWGEFQQEVGEKVRREEMVDGGEVVGVAQWLDRRAIDVVQYAYCPKGPVLRKGTERTEGLKGLRGKIFLRIEPDESSLLPLCVKSIDLSPAHTRITDLCATEDELLAGMHSKTRYNIRLAQKREVKVKMVSSDFEAVWKLFEQTSSRGQFRLHRRGYYEKMLALLLDGECRAFLATASHEGNLLAANVMIDFGDTRTYLHGASSNTYRSLMGPYLLHWELMRDAKARGFTSYDWWGVAPPEPSSIPTSPHPWTGLSRFKRGFPGVESVSPGTYDLVLKPFAYHLYQFGRSLVRAVRRSL